MCLATCATVLAWRAGGEGVCGTDRSLLARSQVGRLRWRYQMSGYQAHSGRRGLLYETRQG